MIFLVCSTRDSLSVGAPGATIGGRVGMPWVVVFSEVALGAIATMVTLLAPFVLPAVMICVAFVVSETVVVVVVLVVEVSVVP